MIRLALAALLIASPAAAHDGEAHGTPAEAAAHVAAAGPAVPFPFKLGGAFRLTDQDGAPRTQTDPDGRMQLLFFGYANCASICSVALPLMAEIAAELDGAGIAVRPVMVTVDPARDTVATIGPPLRALHPDFVGLTGTEAELQAVYDLYSVEKTHVFDDPEHGAVYAHGSHIYLLDGEGRVLTLIPPILGAEQAAKIAAGYAGS